MTTEGSLSPEIVLAEMKKHGITHVVWLPDSEGSHYTSEFRFVALDLFAANADEREDHVDH